MKCISDLRQPINGRHDFLPVQGRCCTASGAALGGLHGDAVEGVAALEEAVEVEDHHQPPGVKDEEDDGEDGGNDVNLRDLAVIFFVEAAPVENGKDEDEESREDAGSDLNDDPPDHERQRQALVALPGSEDEGDGHDDADERDADHCGQNVLLLVQLRLELWV